MLAPLPRCATTVRSGSGPRNRPVKAPRRRIRRRGRETRSGARPRRRSDAAGRRPGPLAAGSVKRGIEAGHLRHRRRHRATALIAATLCGWCSGARGTSASSSASVACIDERPAPRSARRHAPRDDRRRRCDARRARRRGPRRRGSRWRPRWPRRVPGGHSFSPTTAAPSRATKRGVGQQPLDLAAQQRPRRVVVEEDARTSGSTSRH